MDKNRILNEITLAKESDIAEAEAVINIIKVGDNENIVKALLSYDILEARIFDNSILDYLKDIVKDIETSGNVMASERYITSTLTFNDGTTLRVKHTIIGRFLQCKNEKYILRESLPIISHLFTR